MDYEKLVANAERALVVVVLSIAVLVSFTAVLLARF
jgi:hypothetical protein